MKNVLITGGSGSFGNAFVDALLDDPQVERIAIFSRGEHKQAEMARRLQDVPAERLCFMIGDVRDAQRLRRAANGVDTIVHAAALKVVPTLEYNPSEGVRTNVLGAMNVIEAALDNGVERVIGIGSDKGSAPVNLYGATKLCAEKLFTAANAYGGNTTRFSCVRYGNVTGSQGSVVPLWTELAAKGLPLPLTDSRMTRFWMTLPDAVRLVMESLDMMLGGEVFIPKIPSYRITDMAEAIAPGSSFSVIGIRPGEKLHESLIGEHESHTAWDMGDRYALASYRYPTGGAPIFMADPTVPEGFSYRSDTNDDWLSASDIRHLLGLEEIREVA